MTPNYINFLEMADAPMDGSHVILLFIVENNWFLMEGYHNGRHWCGIDPIRLVTIDFVEPVRWARRDDFIDRFKGD